jgi:hypothetical protein
VAIDTPQRIASCFGAVDELIAERGLVTSETVPVISAVAERERPGAHPI